MTSVDGQARLDFLNNHTSLLHGHAFGPMAEAAGRQIERGSSFPAPTELEIELAEELCRRAWAVERIRFTNSGTDAVMVAIKAARGYTGRALIAKFEGCYHGTYDPAEISVSPPPDQARPADAPHSVAESAGLTTGISDEVVVMPFNDSDAVERLVSRHANRPAAILVDPFPHQAGFPEPRPGFLRFLRELADRFGFLLISDEIISFRLAADGAHGKLGFRPHLVTLGKIIGSGFPVGAVGGNAEVMSVFEPRGDPPTVPRGGTFNGNPVSMAAGIESLRAWTDEQVAQTGRLGQELRRRDNEVINEAGIPTQITGDGSLFKIVAGCDR